MSDLLRKGRLTTVRKDVVGFTSSVKDDTRILRHIISINKAHVIMLVEKGIIGRNDGEKILGALVKLDKGLVLRPDIEDAHMAVEEKVLEEVGSDVGGNLNLAKSRNDQVAAAIRMNLREELLSLIEAVCELQEALLLKSQGHLNTIIPGYTHLQPAQPVTFAHYLLAQFDSLQRTLERFKEAYARVDLCPMGAGALATTSFPINRERVADLLGFAGILENSLDAVTTRDFLLEVLAMLSIMAVDVTRLEQDLIVWSTVEFGMIELPDELASSSSIMPQKKNPDVLEAIRARMSIIIGDYMASIVALKALPSSYNLDFQEITPRLWGAIDNAKGCLKMFTEILPNLRVRPDFLDNTALSFLTSTELANILVRNHKVPFRTAHRIVGFAVRVLIEKGRSLTDLTAELLSEASKEFLGSPLDVKVEEIRKAVDLSSFVESHKVRGGPSEGEVKRMMKARKTALAVSGRWVSGKKLRLEEAERSLNSIAQSYMNATSEISQNRNA